MNKIQRTKKTVKESHGRKNIKGSVTIKLNPAIVLSFKAKCKQLGRTEELIKKEIFENAMLEFVNKN